MAWLILLGSAGLEAVWATALGQSEGFTRLGPTVVFLVATTLSMVGLGRAMRTIPLGTAYAVWTGLGAALTAAYAMLTGAEEFSPARVLFLTLIVGAAVGLKMTHGERSSS
ncbi:multidrug efflux SMR transporter [Scrofimicrobium sp. R131]|uniref:Multidrug efflux SMR transporter n=1 Tax=Scrofimicrobium appendicitidis TaxID=3079930 RepID=A0AAU7V6V8_9ACTO